MSSQINYKRMRFHWMHIGTRLLPLQYYSLSLKTAKYSLKLDKIHSLIKISFALHNVPSKTLYCSTCHVIPGRKIPQAPKTRVTSSSFLPNRQPASNIASLAQSDSMMNLPMLSYKWANNSHHKIKNCKHARCTRTTGEQRLRIKKPQSQSRHTYGKNQQHKSSASGR